MRDMVVCDGSLENVGAVGDVGLVFGVFTTAELLIYKSLSLQECTYGVESAVLVSVPKLDVLSQPLMRRGVEEKRRAGL